MSKFEYDPNHELSYGYFRCPSCGSTFYAGGPALHNTGCNEASSGYASCLYVVGPKTILDAHERGETSPGPLDGITLAELRRQLPEAVAAVLTAAGSA